MIVKCNWFVRLKAKLFGLDPSYGILTTIGPIIVRGNTEPPPWAIRHERVHVAQFWELWGIGYLVVFWLFYLRSLARYQTPEAAYLRHPMEREALANEDNPNYLRTRESFAWKKYL
jgi:hypothetical protein